MNDWAWPQWVLAFMMIAGIVLSFIKTEKSPSNPLAAFVWLLIAFVCYAGRFWK